MTDLTSQAERLRVLWKSGRDKYVSFFAVLNEVRKEIGDEALPNWCFDNLRIGITTITKAKGLLIETDREIVKGDLAAANKAHHEQAAAARKAREEERRRKELEELEHEKKIVALKTETTKEEIKRKKVEDTEKTRQRRRANPRMFGPHANANAAKRRLINKLSDADFTELIKRYKKADEECRQAEQGLEEARHRWREASIAKALILLQLRKANPANQDFGEALAANGIKLNHQDRAALIGLASIGENKMRLMLINSESYSYQIIWHNYKPSLTVIEK